MSPDTNELIHSNREAWLLALVSDLRPFIQKKGHAVPEVQISCGWPSSRALSTKKRRIGECWNYKASENGLTQIFISPVLALPHEVSECVVHELGHAALPDAGHKAPFRAFMRSVGLVGKPTATAAGENLKATLEEICAALGPYPNGKLDKMARGPAKKQGTRMRKVSCENDHDPYILRGAKKTLDLGIPICPLCQNDMQVEEGDDHDDV